MKRLLLLILSLVLLLSVCGCKRELSDDTAGFNAADTEMTEVTGGVYEGTEPKEDVTENATDKQEGGVTVQQSIADHTESEELQASQTNENEQEEIPSYYEDYYKKLSEEQLAGLVSVKSPGETVYRFDHDLFSNMPAFKNPVITTVDLPIPAYTEVMSELGTDGIIVAGYADGLRESHRKNSGSHILTSFTITDHYYGAKVDKTITIRENYHLLIEQGYGQFYHNGGYYDSPPLENGEKVLLYLKKDVKTGYYTKCFAQIPLQEDYKNYSKAYLNSLLGFFRGDKAEYPEDKNAELDREAGAVVSPDGSVVYPVDEDGGSTALVEKKVFYWPERKITNEALLAEMSDHVLVQTAVNYKIVIWPYGHKNYTGGSGSSNFHKICKP